MGLKYLRKYFKNGRLGLLLMVLAGLLARSGPALYSGVGAASVVWGQLVKASDLNPVTLTQGLDLKINGRTLKGAWMLTPDATGNPRLLLADMAVQSLLGMALLSTDNLAWQPVRWFGQDGDRPWLLPVSFTNPYRYLDVTDVLLGIGGQWQMDGRSLGLTIPPSNILGLRHSQEAGNDRYVFDLDRPAIWQKTTLPGKVTLDLGAIAMVAQPELSQKDAPFTVKNQGDRSQLIFSLRSDQAVQVSTLMNPPRLVIDLGGDRVETKDILWLPGLRYRQDTVSISRKNFPVTWLELDPKVAPISLQPIRANFSGAMGLSTILNQTQANQMIGGINAGFFNRNNQLPLGAIKHQGEWWSGPILNRGAIAWNPQGQMAFDRLSLEENFLTPKGEMLSIGLLNSGYVKAGIARYTTAWGQTYSPLIDNEVIVTVQNGQVVKQDFTQKAGMGQFAIPFNGYLLVFRSFQSGAAKIPIGTPIQLTSKITPPTFEDYPEIIAAGPLLIKDNRIVLNVRQEQFSNVFNWQAASRSAIARTSDGKILLATVHGTEYSGATLREWANILQKMGAIDALNFDGGGSTSLALGGTLLDRHPSTAGRVNNGIGLQWQQPTTTPNP